MVVGFNKCSFVLFVVQWVNTRTILCWRKMLKMMRLYVAGGLSASVLEDQLRSIFGRYGEIVYTKIPPGKGCGFVQFVDRAAAETAMCEMNNQVSCSRTEPKNATDLVSCCKMGWLFFSTGFLMSQVMHLVVHCFAGQSFTAIVMGYTLSLGVGALNFIVCLDSHKL